MYKLEVPNSVALKEFKAVNHEQFRSSIPKFWSVEDDRRIKPQSICWLFCWAANQDAKYQGPAGHLREVFDTIMPIKYKEFDKRVGKKLADRLRYRMRDADVQGELEKRLSR